MNSATIAYLAIALIATFSIFSANVFQSAYATSDAFVALNGFYNLKGYDPTGVKVNLQTPSHITSIDTDASYWTAVYSYFPNGTLAEFMQIGIDNANTGHVFYTNVLNGLHVFYADAGKYENSGNTYVCYLQSLSGLQNVGLQNCPMPVYPTNVTLTPGDVHTYSIFYNPQSSMWDMQVDGQTVHTVLAPVGTSTMIQLTLETQYINSLISGNAEQIRAPIATATNFIGMYKDGSQSPVVKSRSTNAAYTTGEVNALSVDCNTLTIQIGYGVSQSQAGGCYIPLLSDLGITNSPYVEYGLFAGAGAAIVLGVVLSRPAKKRRRAIRR